MKIQQHFKKRYLSYWLPLLVGIVTTLLVAWVLHFQNEYQIKLYTNNLANNTEKLIAERFQHFEYGLRGARGTIVAVGTENVTRKQFENYIYSRNIEQEFPGAIGFGFIRRVSPSQQSAFINNAREDGAPDFNIRFLTPHDTDRFVIQYIYPLDKNRQAVGLDIGSEINRRSAALSAARDDAPYLTAPITLVQANKKPRKGTLVLLPIYADNVLLNTDEAREKAVVGWSYAPLVIDGVLDGLGSLNDDAFITLTNKTEKDPFYQSTSTALGYSFNHTVVREVFILGQHWKMEISPSNQMLNQIRPWNIGVAVVVCLGMTFVTLLTINFFRANRLTDDEKQHEKIYQFSTQSLLIFFATPRFKQMHRLVLLFFTLILGVSCWLIVKSHFVEINDDLSKSDESVVSELNNVVSKYRKDVLFLANSSAIHVLEKLETDTELTLNSKLESQVVDQLESIKSQQNDESLNHWNERLADIFEAYMLSNINVYQVRFIEANGNWMERVKIQRVGDDLEMMTGDKLQSKASEAYITSTVLAGKGNVFTSDMTLNREYGKIERPSRPMWRFSTPVFLSNGDVFGIVIINVDASSILQLLEQNITINTNLYMTNSEGDFLLHTNKSRAFTFEYDNPHRWQDEFHLLPLFKHIKFSDINGYSGDTGNVFAKHSIFSFQENTSDRFFNIYSTTSLFLVARHIAMQLGVILAVLLFVSLINIVIQYWLWLNDIITQKDSLNAQREEQRNKEFKRFKGLLESAPDATIVVDEHAIIQMVNVQAEKLFGYKRSELEGESIDKLLPIQKKALYIKQLIEYIQQPQQHSGSNRIKVSVCGVNGRPFPAEVNFSSADLDGTLLVNISVSDITERLEQEEQLNIALRDAESATEAKSAFLANTSHEIRTPLNAIIGLGYLLAEEQLTYSQQQLVAKIQISGKSLLGIVNDVLDLAKIEANEMQLDEILMDLPDFFDEVSLVFTSQAEEKNLQFKLDIDPNLPEKVIADSVRLQQILSNLLSNALKFTSKGSVSLAVKVIPDIDVSTAHGSVVEEYVSIRISVTDTGIGIPEEVQARLFKPFVQADNSTARKYGGTGLGLSIVYQLVDLMGGKLGVESEDNVVQNVVRDSGDNAYSSDDKSYDGRDYEDRGYEDRGYEDSVGSTFWVELPLKIQTSKQLELEGQTTHVQKLFVLIAEDESNTQSPLQSMAHALGWRSQNVRTCDDLTEIYTSRRNSKLRPPDVLIVNCDGSIDERLSTLRTVASETGRQNFSAVLMVLDNPQRKAEVEAQDQEQWITGFLTQPLNSSSLFNAVNDAVAKHSGNSKRVLESTRTEAVDVQWLADMQILVVDDHAINLMVISNILEKNGASVQKANSGEEALSLLASSSAYFDAVLMDIQMPGIDGLETTQRIRHDLGLTSLPVIALTAGALLEERNRAFDAGMNDFITKPITPSEVINVLRKLVGSHKDNADLNLPAEELASGINEWPNIIGLNINRAKEMLLYDKSLFLRTLDTLVSDYSDLAVRPKRSIDYPESKELRLQIASQAHKLRSVSGTVGAEKIQQLAEQAENALRTEDKPAYKILDELASELQTLDINCSDILKAWQQEQLDIMDTLSKRDMVPLDIETVSHILGLLEVQDMSALDEFNQYSGSFREAIEDEHFFELQDSLIKLNYKKAIVILSSLKTSMMAR
ncbi:CHASE domain-containing protein [Vibrio sp. TH_r3]|uniref:CHASE domain-containing protein n=1 Tax=Vibrio sp. TH_r3 TaxID=3082084 RepID=UPI002953F7B1|nr:CHASE domain-containing protein [Vibrio sp. TH_r3]MDV7103615.1 CHASE domain-containing protein [Vibrio sp. TH_r3]